MSRVEDEPLFSLDDYVPPGGEVPEHLKGKSPQEVAAYYSAQLKIVDDKAKEKIQAAPAKTQQQTTTTTTVQDPVLKASDVAPAMGTMIASAKMVAKASFAVEGQQLWDRFLPDIENVMKLGFRGAQMADAQNWIFAYNQVLGSKTSLLMKEARDAEVQRRTSESVTPSAGSVKPEDITLDTDQLSVAEQLGIGQEGYKKGIIHSRSNAWPLTFDNRR